MVMQRGQAMHLGVIFPQTEIGTNPKAIRDFVQAAEDLGYDHLIVFDHVLGADTAHYPGWTWAYTHQDMFHEPFVLYGYLAAFTQRMELVTGVLDPGAAPDRPGGQASRRGRRPQRRAAAARGGDWLESRRVRSPWGQFP
jgi:alkanesulfonate monooxygenase SsuD/methylene tetrahydromethanopterin reductase-like flavin-dependent oxidoreductase (luciferase family)